MRVWGRSLRPSKVLVGTTLRPYLQHNPEELDWRGKRKGKPYNYGYIAFDVSKGGPLKKQLDDAMRFMRRHSGDISRIVSHKSVKEAFLDFGYGCRLSEKVFVQVECIPAAFVRLVADLGLEVVLSLYP